MNEEQQLRLQALLDGELPDDEARAVASWMARDAEATALFGELRNTRKALKEFDPADPAPESREFYWSKIQRGIERLEPVARPVVTASLFARFRRLVVSLGAVAAVVIALLVAGPHLRGGDPDTEVVAADAGTFTYQNQESGTTLVWLSYPAEREFAGGTLH